MQQKPERERTAVPDALTAGLKGHLMRNAWRPGSTFVWCSAPTYGNPWTLSHARRCAGIPATFPFQLVSPESESSRAEPASSFWVRTHWNPSRETTSSYAFVFLLLISPVEERNENE